MKMNRLAAILSVFLIGLVSSAWVIKDTQNPVDIYTGSNTTPSISAAGTGAVTLGPVGNTTNQHYVIGPVRFGTADVTFKDTNAGSNNTNQTFAFARHDEDENRFHIGTGAAPSTSLALSGSFKNASSTRIRGAAIFFNDASGGAPAVSTTAGAETGNIVFYTKPAASGIAIVGSVDSLGKWVVGNSTGPFLTHDMYGGLSFKLQQTNQTQIDLNAYNSNTSAGGRLTYGDTARNGGMINIIASGGAGAVFQFMVNQAGDTTTTTADIVGAISDTGIWTIGATNTGVAHTINGFTRHTKVDSSGLNGISFGAGFPGFYSTTSGTTQACDAACDNNEATEGFQNNSASCLAAWTSADAVSGCATALTGQKCLCYAID